MVFVFPVVDSWPIGPEITRHKGAINNVLETRVKICRFRWFYQCVVHSIKDGGDDWLGGVKQSGK